MNDPQRRAESSSNNKNNNNNTLLSCTNGGIPQVGIDLLLLSTRASSNVEALATSLLETASKRPTFCDRHTHVGDNTSSSSREDDRMRDMIMDSFERNLRVSTYKTDNDMCNKWRVHLSTSLLLEQDNIQRTVLDHIVLVIHVPSSIRPSSWSVWKIRQLQQWLKRLNHYDMYEQRVTIVTLVDTTTNEHDDDDHNDETQDMDESQCSLFAKLIPIFHCNVSDDKSREITAQMIWQRVSINQQLTCPPLSMIP